MAEYEAAERESKAMRGDAKSVAKQLEDSVAQVERLQIEVFESLARTTLSQLQLGGIGNKVAKAQKAQKEAELKVTRMRSEVASRPQETTINRCIAHC